MENRGKGSFQRAAVPLFYPFISPFLSGAQAKSWMRGLLMSGLGSSEMLLKAIVDIGLIAAFPAQGLSSGYCRCLLLATYYNY